MLVWLACLAVSAVFYYIVIYRPHQTWKRRNIAYLKPWPVVGNMGPATFRLTSFAENVQDFYNSTKNKYLGVYQYMLPTLLIRDIDLIKQITVKEFDSFTDHRAFISEKSDPVFGNALFSMKGEKWRHMRSTLSPAFTGSKMRSMFGLMSDCGQQFVQHFSKTLRSDQAHTVDLKDMFLRFANDVIATCAFGLQCDSLTDRDNLFYRKGKEASNFSGVQTLKFFGYAVSPFLMHLFKVRFFSEELSNFFRNIVSDTMKTREEQNIFRPDIINLLMEAKKGTLKHESKAKGESAGFATVEESYIGKENINRDWSDDELIAQAVVFFVAGLDAISTTMCHMATELALRPEIQERLQAEIDATIAACNTKLTYDAVMGMKYLDMVVSETMRKWPGGPFLDRICTRSVQLETSPGEKLNIEKGDVIWIPVFPIHHDPEYYPNPEVFDPERFSEDNKHNIKPSAYMPFGIGPRNCIGSRFALLEVKMAFVYILSKFDFVVDKKTCIPFKFSRTTFNLTPAGGFWLAMKLRSK